MRNRRCLNSVDVVVATLEVLDDGETLVRREEPTHIPRDVLVAIAPGSVDAVEEMTPVAVSGLGRVERPVSLHVAAQAKAVRIVFTAAHRECRRTFLVW